MVKENLLLTKPSRNMIWKSFIVIAGLQPIRLCRPISTTPLCGNNSKRILNFPDKKTVWNKFYTVFLKFLLDCQQLQQYSRFKVNFQIISKGIFLVGLGNT